MGDLVDASWDMMEETKQKSFQIIPTKHSCDIYQYSYVCIEFIMSLAVNKRKKVRKPGSLFFCSDNFKVMNKRRGNTSSLLMRKKWKNVL